jgi:hypothetical protein
MEFLLRKRIRSSYLLYLSICQVVCFITWMSCKERYFLKT